MISTQGATGEGTLRRLEICSDPQSIQRLESGRRRRSDVPPDPTGATKRAQTDIPSVSTVTLM